jgi:hypothetical protein
MIRLDLGSKTQLNLILHVVKVTERSWPASGFGRPGPSEANAMMASTPLNGLRFAPNDQPCFSSTICTMHAAVNQEYPW